MEQINKKFHTFRESFEIQMNQTFRQIQLPQFVAHFQT